MGQLKTVGVPVVTEIGIFLIISNEIFIFLHFWISCKVSDILCATGSIPESKRLRDIQVLMSNMTFVALGMILKIFYKNDLIRIKFLTEETLLQ